MTRIWLSITALACILILGCSQSLPIGSSPAEESITVYGHRLHQKATDLATSELARLNAMELMYRNIPMRHRIQNPATLMIDTGWTKVYRRFSGFEVKDVLRSDSLLSPVLYEIEFKYDIFATQFRKEGDGSALEETKMDKVYEPLYSDVLNVKYGCNEEGELMNPDLGFLPRPNYYRIKEFNEVVLGAKPPQVQP